MEDNDRHFSTDSLRRGENGESDFAAQSVDEQTEPGVGTESVTATEATPAAPLDESDRQHPDANAPILAILEDKKEPGLRVEAAATNEPDLFLIRQLIGSVRLGGDEQFNWTLIDDAVGLYRSLKPQDPIESVFSRLIVAGTNATMDCLGG